MNRQWDEITEIFQAKKEACEEGIEIGAVRTALEAAHKMLAKGLDFSFISEITGLSEQQIAELVRETATEQEH